jgi:hypothetical protein
MKITKAFLKMTKTEQEEWLVTKLNEAYSQVDEVKRLLSKVRGGMKIDIEIDRPDLALLKE